MTHDLYADKPWALVRPSQDRFQNQTLTPATQSPLLSTVNYLSLAPIKPDATVPPFDFTVSEDITPVAKAEELKGHPDKRKNWLSDSKGHEGISLGPDVLVRRFASSPRAPAHHGLVPAGF